MDILNKIGKILLYLMLTALFFNMVGCSSKFEVSGNLYSFTEEEQNELLSLAYNYLDNSIQNSITDSNKGEITGFKTSGSNFEVSTNKNEIMKDIQNTDTILVTFEAKKESELQSIKVYIDEHGDKVLGFLTPEK